MSGRLGESVCNGADVGWVATAASSEVANPLSARAFAEFNEVASRELDSFQLVRELWKTGERLTLRGCAKGTGLCRNGHSGSFTHLTKQRQHHRRSLLAIRAHRNRTKTGHAFGALGWRVTVTA